MRVNVMAVCLCVGAALCAGAPVRGQDNFAAHQEFAVGDGPQGIATADFNGDGRPDVIVANERADSLSVLYAQPDGSLGGRVNYPMPGPVNCVSVGDLNNDGRPDIAVSLKDQSSVSVLYAQPAGGFGGLQTYTVGNTPRNSVVGDFNRDGRNDLAVANAGGASVTVLYGQEAGGLGGALDFPVRPPGDIDTADLNHDGVLDLVTVSWDSLYNGQNVNVLPGNADGTFGDYDSYYANRESHGVAIADLNCDGHPDIAAVGQTSVSNDKVYVHYNRGDGVFEGMEGYWVGDVPMDVVAGDFNRDGRADLAVLNNADYDVTVLYGLAEGGFGNAWDYPVANYPWDLVAADFDGNGAIDLAVTSYWGDSVSVLYNTLPEPGTLALVAVGLSAMFMRRRRLSS